jgi:4-hydroxyacetophenone monooxygenase
MSRPGQVKESSFVDKRAEVDLDLVRRAVHEAHVPSLLASLVHITGDPTLLTEERRTRGMVFLVDEGAPIAPEEEKKIREIAVSEIAAYLRRGRTLPPGPSWDTLRKMMEFVAGEFIRSEFLPFLREELAVEGDDLRRPNWSAADFKRKEGHRPQVVIVGAGMSGILAGIRLKQAGIDFTILEKNSELGGTWFENDYPGCRIDVGGSARTGPFRHLTIGT